MGVWWRDRSRLPARPRTHPASSHRPPCPRLLCAPSSAPLVTLPVLAPCAINPPGPASCDSSLKVLSPPKRPPLIWAARRPSSLQGLLLPCPGSEWQGSVGGGAGTLTPRLRPSLTLVSPHRLPPRPRTPRSPTPLPIQSQALPPPPDPPGRSPLLWLPPIACVTLGPLAPPTSHYSLPSCGPVLPSPNVLPARRPAASPLCPHSWAPCSFPCPAGDPHGSLGAP